MCWFTSLNVMVFCKRKIVPLSSSQTPATTHSCRSSHPVCPSKNLYYHCSIRLLHCLSPSQPLVAEKTDVLSPKRVHVVSQMAFSLLLSVSLLSWLLSSCTAWMFSGRTFTACNSIACTFVLYANFTGVLQAQLRATLGRHYVLRQTSANDTSMLHTKKNLFTNFHLLFFWLVNGM